MPHMLCILYITYYMTLILTTYDIIRVHIRPLDGCVGDPTKLDRIRSLTDFSSQFHVTSDWRHYVKEIGWPTSSLQTEKKPTDWQNQNGSHVPRNRLYLSQHTGTVTWYTLILLDCEKIKKSVLMTDKNNFN